MPGTGEGGVVEGEGSRAVMGLIIPLHYTGRRYYCCAVNDVREPPLKQVRADMVGRRRGSVTEEGTDVFRSDAVLNYKIKRSRRFRRLTHSSGFPYLSGRSVAPQGVYTDVPSIF